MFNVQTWPRVRGTFVDAPSYFGINCDVVLKDYTVETTSDSILIDTGDIRLIYKDDGQWESQTFKLDNAPFGQRGYTAACVFECSGFADLTVEGV